MKNTSKSFLIITKLTLGLVIGLVVFSPTQVRATSYDDVFIVDSDNVSVDLSVLEELSPQKKTNFKKVYAPSPDTRPIKPKKGITHRTKTKVKKSAEKKTNLKQPVIATKPAIAEIEERAHFQSQKKLAQTQKKLKKAVASEKVVTQKQKVPVISVKSENLSPALQNTSDMGKKLNEQKGALPKTVTPLSILPIQDKSVDLTTSKQALKEPKKTEALKQQIEKEKINKDGVPIPKTDKTEPVKVEELVNIAPVTSSNLKENTLPKTSQESLPFAVPSPTPVVPVEPQEVINESDDVLIFSFEPENTTLTKDMSSTLSDLVAKMRQDTELGIRVLAYAKDDEEKSSKARRKSLSRALAVRSFLIDNGVRSTRIEVRALGNKIQQDKLYIEKIKRK